MVEGNVSGINVNYPQHFLYFFPDPNGHGSFRPGFGSARTGMDQS